MKTKSALGGAFGFGCFYFYAVDKSLLTSFLGKINYIIRILKLTINLN